MGARCVCASDLMVIAVNNPTTPPATVIGDFLYIDGGRLYQSKGGDKVDNPSYKKGLAFLYFLQRRRRS